MSEFAIPSESIPELEGTNTPTCEQENSFISFLRYGFAEYSLCFKIILGMALHIWQYSILNCICGNVPIFTLVVLNSSCINQGN